MTHNDPSPSSRATKFAIAAVVLGFIAVVCVYLLLTLRDTTSHYVPSIIADNNRDGALDHLDAIQAGQFDQAAYAVKPTYNAMVLVNCDDDNGDGIADMLRNSSTPISDAENDTEPLKITLPDDISEFILLYLELAVPDNDNMPTIPASQRLRIIGPDGRELLGPTQGTHADFNTTDGLELARKLSNRDGILSCEGLYFNAVTVLKLVAVPAHGEERSCEIHIRCSPFIVSNNTMPISESGNIFSSDALLTEAFEASIGPVTRVSYNFCQSVVEVGYQYVWTVINGKRVKRGMPVLLELLDTIEWKPQPHAGFGVFNIPGYDKLAARSIEYGGALECLPPLPGDERRPFGTILLSRRGEEHSRLKDFLGTQVQPIAEIDFDGLWIDHVNELICPVASGKGHVILVACLKSAIDLLRTMEDGNWPVNGMFYMPNGTLDVAAMAPLTTAMVRGIYYSNDGSLTEGARQIIEAIDRTVEQLNSLGYNNIARVPVLFDASRKLVEGSIEGKVWVSSKTIIKKANYLSASLANSQPIVYRDSNWLFVPYIAEYMDGQGIFVRKFVDTLRSESVATGTVVMVNFYPRFINGGQIHCCSNVIRIPNDILTQ